MSNILSASKSPKGEADRSQSQPEQETLLPPLVRRAGLWSGTAYAILNVVYTGLLVATLITGYPRARGGTIPPPVEPYQTMFHVLTLCGVALLVFLWSVLHSAAPNEKKLFSRASLAMIVIMATLTSINRYVALTVVRQSKLERGMFWTLILTGVLSLLAALGQVFYPTPLSLAGFLAWGPGLTLVAVLIVIWFTKARTQS
jgi:hypothetical protein